MIGRAGLVLAAALISPTLPATGGELTDWFIQTGGEPRQVVEIGAFTPDGPEILGADPLTYGPDYPIPFTSVPQTPATVIALVEPIEGRTALAALIFRDGRPVCGTAAGEIWVDSGTAAFLTRSTATKLAAMRDDFQSREQNLYDDYFAAPDQMGDSAFAKMLSLPDGTEFPGFSSGWGDGAYPVVKLFDGSGNLLAIYADFIGSEKLDDFILPPLCEPPVT